MIPTCWVCTQANPNGGKDSVPGKLSLLLRMLDFVQELSVLKVCLSLLYNYIPPLLQAQSCTGIIKTEKTHVLMVV